MAIAASAICYVSHDGAKSRETNIPIETDGLEVTGTIVFEELVDGSTRITFDISGLTPGSHGMHIHETSDFSNCCISAGPHFNPFNKQHGGPDVSERHVGDLGNILANFEGRAAGTIQDKLIKLNGETSVMGRSVIIHADPDDLGCGGHELSKTTGNSGLRVACGRIVSKL
jgi:Cu-Zn family superoxide dismutase